MLNLKKHHWLGVLVVAFALAWALWTFFWLPASEMPNLPETPVESAPS